MGVFYDVRVHLAETADDYQGKKSSTVAMGIRKVPHNSKIQQLLCCQHDIEMNKQYQ